MEHEKWFDTKEWKISDDAMRPSIKVNVVKIKIKAVAREDRKLKLSLVCCLKQKIHIANIELFYFSFEKILIKFSHLLIIELNESRKRKILSNDWKKIEKKNEFINKNSGDSNSAEFWIQHNSFKNQVTTPLKLLV